MSRDRSQFYFTAGEHGKHPIVRVASSGGVPVRVVPNVFASGLRITADGRKLVFLGSSMIAAPEVYSVNTDGSGLMALTTVNKELLGPENLKAAEDVEWTGAMGKKVHGFIGKSGSATW